MRDHVLVSINGRPHEVRGDALGRPLTDLLRHELGLSGTKVVCAEGDCGACTTLVARPGGPFLPIDACIQYLWQLDGALVVTVEGLAEDGELHPVQKALVAHHGSQCGYCTPGFVMAIAGLREEGGALDEARVGVGLSGNLCRCTGYTSIVAAALAQQHEAATPLAARYADALAALDGLRSAVLTVDGQTIALPTTLSDALAFRAAHPGAVVWAGGTDLGVQRNKGRPAPAVVLALTHLDSLDGITELGDTVRFGARTSWSTIEAWAKDALPELAGLLELFGAPQIRNAGTIGGNLANASPIGDGLPFLLATDAVVHTASMRGVREVPIAKFFLGYRKIDLADDELITAIDVRLPGPGQWLRLDKVSRRLDLDISTVSAAFRLDVDQGQITDARVAFGGVAATPVRLTEVERWLIGRPPDLATLTEAGALASAAVSPISDVRGSAAYRSALVANLLRRLGHVLASEGSVR